MRHSPDGEFHYIGHFTDHMTKFHILFPLFVYDSMQHELTEATKELIIKYHGEKINICTMNVQQQKNGSDCGIFAIAFAKAILCGQDPTQLEFMHPRNHLSKYLPLGQIPPFPSVPVIQQKACWEMKTDLLELSHFKIGKQCKPKKLKELMQLSDEENEFEVDILENF